jgi:HEAT repeat protein
MATKPNVAELVSQMPEVDKPGTASKFTGPDPVAAAKIFAEIFAGGSGSILELIDLVKAPDDADFKDYKAAYVVHGLVLYAGVPGREKERRQLAELLASRLSGEKSSAAAKTYFIQELQACGGRDVVPALARALSDEALAEPATRALLAIREGVGPELQRALTNARGRQRVGIVLALGQLAEPLALPVLRESLRDEDAAVRLAAAWSLAKMGDAASAEAIFKLADGATGDDRRQSTSTCLLLAETLVASGKTTEARQLLIRLRDSRQEESERFMRDAADRALKALQPHGAA